MCEFDSPTRRNKGVRPLNITLMAMHNPSRPGEFIIQVYLDPNNLSVEKQRGRGVSARSRRRVANERVVQGKT